MKKILQKVTLDLETVLKKGIRLNRAFDLLEASTNDIREIIVLNTLREEVIKEQKSLA